MSTEPTTVPRLTVGLPTYNREGYLAGALDSILAQTFTDFELIISDNASTDGTEQIAREYARRDPRIRYVRHPRNRGSAFNHTYVIKQARGEYFKWAADDDLYAPDLFERCVQALDAHPEISLAHAWTTSIDETGAVLDKEPYVLDTASSSPARRFRSLLYTDGGDDIYGVMRTRILATMPDYGSYYHSDRTFVAEVAMHGAFHNHPDHLYLRREHSERGGQASVSMRRMCSILDPARADRWRHPKVRLLGEYLTGYLAAIHRAPITRREKLACLWVMLVWVAAHGRPLRGSRTDHGAASTSPDLPARRPASVRSVAFYGLLGSGNIGNDASLETLLWWFQDRMPGVQLSCVTIAPAETRARYGLRSLPLAMQGPSNQARLKLSVPRRIIGRIRDVPHAAQIARSADAVLVPGMGVLEEKLGTRPWGWPAWLLSVALACRVMGRRFVLIGVGAEPIANSLTRRLFDSVVGAATYVSYRDAESASAMQGSGRQPDAVGVDVAFAHPAPADPKPQQGVVVLGVMDYHGPDGDRVAGRVVHERYVADMIDVVIGLLDAGNCIHLVVGDALDVQVADRIRDGVLDREPQAATAVTVRAATTFEELTEQMSRAEVVVASRYHNLICALRLGRPVISLSYAQKNAWLMRRFGLERHERPIEDLRPEALSAEILQLARDGAVLSEHILATASELRQEAIRLLEDATHKALSNG